MTALKNLTVKFHEIPQGGLDFHLSQSTGELNASLFDLLGDFPVYDAVLNVQPSETMVQVKGRLSGELNHVCSRCAEEFRQTYEKSFTTAFYKSEENIKESGAFEDMEGSFDLEFLEGNDINLADIVHEQVALEVPFKPLCKEDCRGLCSHCGSNLNLSLCQCAEKGEFFPKTSPFEKLKSLRGE